MTRFTSIGIKKKKYHASAAEEAAIQANNEESLAKASAPVEPTASTSEAPAVLQRKKQRRGTRGSKDKKSRKSGDEGAIEGPVEPDQPSTASTSSQQHPTVSVAEALAEAESSRALLAGRKTMAGRDAPKPGESPADHQKRMEVAAALKREKNRERRKKDEAARLVASEQRRLSRIAERDRNTTCYACREQGHSARDCPRELKARQDESLLENGGEKPKNKSGVDIRLTGSDTVSICYRCGSSSHSLSRCPVVVNHKNPMPYASCFVCLEKGHLASKCPQNTDRGAYPNGGGGCKFCGGKDHLIKDCNVRKDAHALETTLLEPSSEPTRALGADEDDFHQLKRKSHHFDKEEKFEKGVAGRPTVRRRIEEKAAAVPKKKVVAF